jgi:hypothetical protein
MTVRRWGWALAAGCVLGCGSDGDGAKPQDQPQSAFERWALRQTEYADRRCRCHLADGDFVSRDDCLRFVSAHPEQLACNEAAYGQHRSPAIDDFLDCFGAAKIEQGRCYAELCADKNALSRCTTDAGNLQTACGDIRMIAPEFATATVVCR